VFPRDNCTCFTAGYHLFWEMLRQWPCGVVREAVYCMMITLLRLPWHAVVIGSIECMASYF